MDSSWTSYPSIFAMGHKAISDLLSVDVNVEEKVDGSQFSFGLVPASDVDITYGYFEEQAIALKIRSKGCVMHPDAPEKMFNDAAATVKELAPKLHPLWTYRGEFVKGNGHNTLKYDRGPKGSIIIFDINTGNQEYLSYDDKKAEAERLGLECVPLLFSGRIDSIESFRRFLSTTSILGGQLVEGVVVKPSNYNLYGPDKKVLMGKFVSELFKEAHRKSWGESNPTSKDIVSKIVETFRTPASWTKAVQHLRDRGELKEDVRDIGALIKEIPEDVLKENEDEMKDMLFAYAWPHVRRGLTAGFAQWYKEQLLKASFERDVDGVGHEGASLDLNRDSSISNDGKE